MIDGHNDAVHRFEEIKRNATNIYKIYLLAVSKEDHDNWSNQVASARGEENNAQRRLRIIEALIDRQQRRFDSRAATASVLTQDLSDYLGHDDLKLTSFGNFYRVTRDGEPAIRLSEGEISAIALMYFLRSLESQELSSSDITVVLDDPVNSMDTNSLNNAVAFIKNRIKGLGQLIILTHNFIFMKETLRWLRRKEFKDRRQFYMLQTFNQNGHRSSTLELMDRTLVRFHSEYHYMFHMLMECSQQTVVPDIHSFYHIPNFCRRVLETFAGFRFPDATGSNQPFGVFREHTQDDAKIDAIQRFTDELSHGIDAGGPDPEIIQLTESPRMARDVLELIKTIDCDHYEEMCKAIENSTNNSNFD